MLETGNDALNYSEVKSDFEKISEAADDSEFQFSPEEIECLFLQLVKRSGQLLQIPPSLVKKFIENSIKTIPDPVEEEKKSQKEQEFDEKYRSGGLRQSQEEDNIVEEILKPRDIIAYTLKKNLGDDEKYSSDQQKEMLIETVYNILLGITKEMIHKSTTTRNIMDPWVYTIKHKKTEEELEVI